MEVYKFSGNLSQPVIKRVKDQYFVVSEIEPELLDEVPEEVTGEIVIEPAKFRDLKNNSNVAYLALMTDNIHKVSVYQNDGGKQKLAGQVFVPYIDAPVIDDKDIIDTLKQVIMSTRVQGYISGAKDTEVFIGIEQDARVSYFKYDTETKKVTPMFDCLKYSLDNFNYTGTAAFPVFIYGEAGYDRIDNIRMFSNGKKIASMLEVADIHYPESLSSRERKELILGSCMSFYDAVCTKIGVDGKTFCKQAYGNYFDDNPRVEHLSPVNTFSVRENLVEAWHNSVGSILCNSESVIAKDILDLYNSGLNVTVIEYNGEAFKVLTFEDDGNNCALLRVDEKTVEEIRRQVPALGYMSVESIARGYKVASYAMNRDHPAILLGQDFRDEIIPYAAGPGIVATALERLNIEDEDIVQSAIDLYDTFKPIYRFGLGNLPDSNLIVYTGKEPQNIIAKSNSLYLEGSEEKGREM